MNCLSKCIKLYLKNINTEKKICVPTLPKIFRPVTRNTLLFLFGLTEDWSYYFRYSHSEVILTADQANCLISDRGNEIMIEKPGQQLPPANVGDVSLGMSFFLRALDKSTILSVNKTLL